MHGNLVPRTIEGWRSLESRAITSRDTFVAVRKSNRLYMLSGMLFLSRDQGNMSEGDIACGIVRFGIRMTFPDSTSSALYEMALRSGNPSHSGEKALECILSRHNGCSVSGSVGGRYAPHDFHVNYIKIPDVEAVVIKGHVLQMLCGGAAFAV